MKHTHLTPSSSAISHVEFDELREELTVHFRARGSATYREVPRHKFHELKKADSVGGFINSQIKPHHAQAL